MSHHPINLEQALSQAASWIAEADSLVISTGAGMSVDSGLPDFRGPEGFWRAYPALGREQLGFTDIANPRAFYDNPERAWGFYGHRLNLYRRTEPHTGYGLLLHWGHKMPNHYQVFTSNVDGHFFKAGFDLMRVHECHGSIHYLQCLEPCGNFVWSAAEFQPEVDENLCRLRSHTPRCTHCGRLARPNILMFDDVDWIYERTRKQHLYQERWLERVAHPLVIEIGAGTAVPSARHFSARIQHEHHARLIRINPNDELTTEVNTLHLPYPALMVLTQLQAELVKAYGSDWQLE